MQLTSNLPALLSPSVHDPAISSNPLLLPIIALLRPSVTSSLKFSNRSIAIAVPPLWNKLPPALRQISYLSYEVTKTPPLAISPRVFHSKLKTLLFDKSYPESNTSPCLPRRLNTTHHPP